jgi:hypothetical protein
MPFGQNLSGREQNKQEEIRPEGANVRSSALTIVEGIKAITTERPKGKFEISD